MPKKSAYKWEKIIIAAAAVLTVLVLGMAAASYNTIEQDRKSDGYLRVRQVDYRQFTKADAPLVVAEEYRFTLGTIGHADALAFYINHYNIRVSIGGKVVYEAVENAGNFRTTGGIYAMIPLEEEDAGKEVQVVLSPLYQSYRDQTEFLVGSELAIYKDAFERAVPELLLCLCTVLVGLFLLFHAVYYSIRHTAAAQMYGIGMLAVSTGLWRFTYGSFVHLLFPEHSVFIYTLSVISLMVMTLSLLGCVKIPKTMGKVKKAIRSAMIVYGVIDVVQLFLQFIGILDLRQTLWVTHAMVVFSAAVVLLCSIVLWLPGEKHTDRGAKGNHSWILGIGAILDLLLYYFAENSFGMLFTLTAILCFSVMEGIGLLLNFSRQKNELEEMQTQLTLSRTATMMSQIRSHFVFNLLNAISGMCKYDPQKADDTVVRFARYLRNNIDIMEDDHNIPFATDLRQLEDYVILEQVRFGDKIEFYTDIETVDFMIPPLILQPVVENAIKHGISKKQSGGTIILRTKEEAGAVKIFVEDDGVGFDLKELEKESSVGLRNICFRLKHLVSGTLDITSRIGEGTTVTITIPKENRIKET